MALRGLLDRVAYDYEQMSVGWWPGSATFTRPAFYAYAYPKPEGIEDTTLDVPGAHWDTDLREFILDYDDVWAGLHFLRLQRPWSFGNARHVRSKLTRTM